MKELIVCLLLLFSCIGLHAQGNMEDVIYMKNGGSLRGNILKNSDSVQFRIQTKDGSIFVCKLNEVDKVIKEKIYYSRTYSSKSPAARLEHYKRSGIGLTTMEGIFLLAGSCTMGIHGQSRYDDTYIGPGQFLAGISLLCMSAPFVISAPIMLSKHANLKKELKAVKEVSFVPAIYMHRMDGITTNPAFTVMSYGAKVQLRF